MKSKLISKIPFFLFVFLVSVISRAENLEDKYLHIKFDRVEIENVKGNIKGLGAGIDAVVEIYRKPKRGALRLQNRARVYECRISLAEMFPNTSRDLSNKGTLTLSRFDIEYGERALAFGNGDREGYVLRIRLTNERLASDQNVAVATYDIDSLEKAGHHNFSVDSLPRKRAKGFLEGDIQVTDSYFISGKSIRCM